MTTAITSFWAYFKENHFAFQMLHELDPETKHGKLNELNHLINIFHPRIGYVFNFNSNNLQFIVTAYGNPYLFKSVELLVKFAPEINPWKISAFIPPSGDTEQYKSGTDKPFNYHGISLRISEMKYSTVIHENNPLLLSINVYIKNYIVHSYNDYLVTAVYTLLEHLLGEKSFTNEIHTVNICQLTEEVDAQSVPLYNLPEYVKIARNLSANELQA